MMLDAAMYSSRVAIKVDLRRNRYADAGKGEIIIRRYRNKNSQQLRDLPAQV